MTSAEVALQVSRTYVLVQRASQVSDLLEQATDEALLALSRWGHDSVVTR